MSASCCSIPKRSSADPRWRQALWIALAVNAGMFLVEVAGGAATGSRALMADALDFFGDAANYALSLAVAGLAPAVRATAALLKGVTLLVLGLWVLVATLWGAFAGTSPRPEAMGLIGAVALVANMAVALLLFRFRTGDANMRSVWICSRNDAIGNLMVIAAAAGVFGTGTVWPDLAVAAVLAGLAVAGGAGIVAQARNELRAERAAGSAA